SDSVTWSEGAASFYVLRAIHEGESSRWCLGVRLLSPSLLAHEKTFARSVREKCRVFRRVKINPWPVLSAIDLDWKSWNSWLQESVAGAPPLVDNNYVALWRLNQLADTTLKFPSKILVLDGHHSLEAQRTVLPEKPITSWVLPRNHPELHVRPIHRAGWLKATIEKALQKQEITLIQGVDNKKLAFDPHVTEVIQSQKRFYVRVHKQDAIDWVGGLDNARTQLRTSPDIESLVNMLTQNECDTVLQMAQLEKKAIFDRASQGLLYPQKATYFFPKVPFGWLVERLV
ncbi:MAG TPA: DUF1015 family protein, partial [Oligoflexia bacterium]|nr:DUF1015 family protein [Oligoflexia bacterium]